MKFLIDGNDRVAGHDNIDSNNNNNDMDIGIQENKIYCIRVDHPSFLLFSTFNGRTTIV